MRSVFVLLFAASLATAQTLVVERLGVAAAFAEVNAGRASKLVFQRNPGNAAHVLTEPVRVRRQHFEIEADRGAVLHFDGPLAMVHLEGCTFKIENLRWRGVNGARAGVVVTRTMSLQGSENPLIIGGSVNGSILDGCRWDGAWSVSGLVWLGAEIAAWTNPVGVNDGGAGWGAILGSDDVWGLGVNRLTPEQWDAYGQQFTMSGLTVHTSGFLGGGFAAYNGAAGALLVSGSVSSVRWDGQLWVACRGGARGIVVERLEPHHPRRWGAPRDLYFQQVTLEGDGPTLWYANDAPGPGIVDRVEVNAGTHRWGIMGGTLVGESWFQSREAGYRLDPASLTDNERLSWIRRMAANLTDAQTLGAAIEVLRAMHDAGEPEPGTQPASQPASIVPTFPDVRLAIDGWYDRTAVATP